IRAAASSNLGIVALMVILFSGLAYGFFRRSKEIWRFSALSLFFVGCMSFGYAVFKSATEIAVAPLKTELLQLTDYWIAEAEQARAAETFFSGRQPPTSLLDARNRFEGAWKQASLAEHKLLNAEKASKALSYLNRLYRVIEAGSSTQPNANFWA